MSKSVDLRSLVESHIQPFLVIDRRNRVVAANRAFQQRFGVDVREAVGQSCFQLLAGPADRPCPCRSDGGACPFTSIFEGAEPLAVDRVLLDFEGQEHRVRVHAFPLHREDGEIYLAELIQELPRPGPSERRRRPCDDGMVGHSRAFRHLQAQLDRAAASGAPVLLHGATGTGKELAAHYIHGHSARSARQMMTIDCTVLTEALFESEVFGHERGAFTGSIGQRDGLFELADGGTLFLDEIGELSMPLQAKLLRVLETGEFRRVGGRRNLRANVRLICATNRDLRCSSAFRQDLYYRVSVESIQVPSLAERIEDVPDLAIALLEQIGRDLPVARRLTPAALRRLQRYSYPGNIRELRNILWAAAARCHDGLIDFEDIDQVLPADEDAFANPEYADLAGVIGGEIDADPGRDPLDLEQLEAAHLSRLLQRFAGNRRRVAEALGVSERTIYRKLKRHNLH